MTSLWKIVSGGQTGVDRGALDAAMDVGIAHGGKCPKGRLAEDGVIPMVYELEESVSRKYSVRTEQNVVESDGTLILFFRRLTGGTELTRRFAIKHAKPFLLYDYANPVEFDAIIHWLQREGIGTLNCAGPRESTCEGIGMLTRRLCRELFEEVMREVGSDSSIR